MSRENQAPTRTGRRRRERGQSVIELALTAPIIVLLLIGLVELGNGLNTYLTILASARDAARLGAQGSASDAALINLVGDETDRLPNTVPATCSVGNPGICITHTTLSSVPAIKVKVCYNYDLLVTGLGIIPNPLLVCSETSMRVLS